MIKVDKGIEIPQPTGRQKRYPFRLMAVGDSFFSDSKASPMPLASKFGKKHGVKFTSRRVDGGWRIWRIE